MHEMSVMMGVLDAAVKHAEMNAAEKITKICLNVGELSDMEDKWMQHYFDFHQKVL